MKDEKGYKGNMWDRMGGMSVRNFYSNKVVDGDWKDSSVSEVKGSFKWHLLVIATIFIVGTI